MPHYDGKCYCEKINFTCDGEPIFTQYCHCNKCREVASLSKRDTDKLGYSLTAAYHASNFHIRTGMDCLDEIIRNNAKLFLCSDCHSLIYGISLDPALQAGIGVNVNNFNFYKNILPDTFKPIRHTWYINHIVNFDDDLPKYKDVPKEQFGSGELYE